MLDDDIDIHDPYDDDGRERVMRKLLMDALKAKLREDEEADRQARRHPRRSPWYAAAAPPRRPVS